MQKLEDFDNKLSRSVNVKCHTYTNINNFKISNPFHDNVSLLISRHSEHGINPEQNVLKRHQKVEKY